MKPLSKSSPGPKHGIFINKTLCQYRRARDLLQTELAEKAGVSQSVITHYEVGRKRASLQHIFLLADALGCLPRDLAPEADLIVPDALALLVMQWDRLSKMKQKEVLQAINGVLE